VDDVIIFRPLGTAEIEHIVDLQLGECEAVARRTEARARSHARGEAGDRRRGYDPVYGARPLKRAIQRLIQNPLALAVLAEATPRATA